MPVLDPAHVIRKRLCSRHGLCARDAAFQAAQLLVLAYSTGRRASGGIRWEDLDLAYDAACEALRLDRTERPRKC